MSTILKALRRLEEDKRTQTSMSLDEAVVEPQASSGRSGVGILLATGATALAGIAALLWATSGIWLSSEEDLQGPVASAPAPVAAVPQVARVEPREVEPPPAVAAIPIRSPSEEGRIEAFANPAEIRREMQRLAGVSPDSVEAVVEVEAEVEPAPPVRAVPKPEPRAKPKPQPKAKARAQTEPKPRERAKPAAKKTVVAKAAPPPVSPPAPVSAPASVGPVEVVQRKAAPEVAIRQISWHPTPGRRVATFLVEGESATVSMREGEIVAGYTIAEIGISEVELVRDGVAVRRRVGN